MALPQIALDDGRQHEHGPGPQTRPPRVDPGPLQAFSPRQQTGTDDGLRQQQPDSSEQDDRSHLGDSVGEDPAPKLTVDARPMMDRDERAQEHAVVEDQNDRKHAPEHSQGHGQDPHVEIMAERHL